MKYELLKDLPDKPAGSIVEGHCGGRFRSGYDMSAYPEFFKPVVTKRRITLEEIRRGDAGDLIEFGELYTSGDTGKLYFCDTLFRSNLAFTCFGSFVKKIEEVEL